MLIGHYHPQVVKFYSPQNISGASHQNKVSAFSSTTEVDGSLFEKVDKLPRKNIKWLHAAHRIKKQTLFKTSPHLL